jgi:hypothetical protein
MPGPCTRMVALNASAGQVATARINGLTAKAKIVVRILPLLLVPAFAAAVVYWLTHSRIAAVTAGAVAFGAMLFIGVTS